MRILDKNVCKLLTNTIDNKDRAIGIEYIFDKVFIGGAKRDIDGNQMFRANNKSTHCTTSEYVNAYAIC